MPGCPLRHVTSQGRSALMASGFGHLTPMGRCYPVYVVSWHRRPARSRSSLQYSPCLLARALGLCQDFKDCLSAKGMVGDKCKELGEDYMECLHHKKEVRTHDSRDAASRPRPRLLSTSPRLLHHV